MVWFIRVRKVSELNGKHFTISEICCIFCPGSLQFCGIYIFFILDMFWCVVMINWISLVLFGVKNFLNFATKCYRMWTLYTSLEVLDISTCNFSLRCQHIIQQRFDESRGLSAVQGVDVTLNSYNFFERKCIAAGRESFELDFRSLLPAFIKTGLFSSQTSIDFIEA